MGKDNVALEGVFNPDITIRDIVAKVRTTLESRYTSIDSTEQLLARMDTDRNEIKQLILDISNVMAQVHNGAMSKTDAIDEVRPMVKQLKSECVALKLVDELSPDDDICETELQMLSEAITQIHAAVEDHLNTLKANEGSDRDGRAGTIADGAQTETTGSATESLYKAMMSGNTLACESIMRSDNMSDISVMSEMLAMEADDGAAAPAAASPEKESRVKKIAEKLKGLIDRILTWIARRVQQLRSIGVKVGAEGKKFSAAAKAAAQKSTTAANQLYAGYLKALKGEDGAMDAGKSAIDSVMTDLRAAHDAKTSAKVTINNMPLDVFDYVKGTLERIKAITNKGQEAAQGAKSQNAKAFDHYLTLTGQLSRLTTSLQNMLGGTGDAGADASKADQRKAAGSAKREDRLYSAKASDRAIDGKPEKKGDSNTAAAESYDAIAMARAAAAEGDLEGVVESLLLAMSPTAQVQDDGAEESLFNAESDELDSALECAMLEMDMFD